MCYMQTDGIKIDINIFLKNLGHYYTDLAPMVA